MSVLYLDQRSEDGYENGGDDPKEEVQPEADSILRDSLTDRWLAESSFLEPLTTNSAMGAKQVRECCQLDAESKGHREHAMEQMNFSVRAHDRRLFESRSWLDQNGRSSIFFLGKS